MALHWQPYLIQPELKEGEGVGALRQEGQGLMITCLSVMPSSPMLVVNMLIYSKCNIGFK